MSGGYPRSRGMRDPVRASVERGIELVVYGDIIIVSLGVPLQGHVIMYTIAANGTSFHYRIVTVSQSRNQKRAYHHSIRVFWPDHLH